MSNLKYAMVEEETLIIAVNSCAEEKQPQPYLMSRVNAKAGELTRRVESALDAGFANGSMPA